MSHSIGVYNPLDGSTSFPTPAPGAVVPCVLGNHDAPWFSWDRTKGRAACEACILSAKAGRLGVTREDQIGFAI